VIGKINIIGDIGSYEDKQGNLVKGVDLMDVIAQVKSQPEALSFEVTIDSLGGFCDVGYDIHDYLKTIKKPVTTIAVNKCASIATVIFLAGSVRTPLCNLMIHNPWIGSVSGDADEMERAAADIRAEEDKLIDFYAKATGLEKIALDALMKKEAYIDPEMAVKLGFATKAPTENLTLNKDYKAVARLNETPMSKETKDLLSKMGETLDAVKSFMAGKKPEEKKTPAKALMVPDKDGKNLNITNADGSEITGVPVAGNMVTIDGALAEGEYVLPSLNVSITVGAGVITAVTDMAQDSAEKKLETANKKIADLEKENSTMKAELNENKKDTATLAEQVAEFETILKAMNGKPAEHQAKNQFRSDDTKKDDRPLKERMAEYKAKQAEKNKK
jgi:ATP-dependent protease ClpP protease subunit